MKIALVRGPSLNQPEMQNFEPLAEIVNFLVAASKKSIYEIDEIKLPIKKLTCLGELFGSIPGGIGFLYRTLGDPQCLLGLERVITGSDIVHTAETSNYYSWQAILARNKGLVKKVVVTCWENLAFNREANAAQKKLKARVRERADHFLAVTQQAKKALIKEGVEAEKITVIPMGVDLDKFGVGCRKYDVESKKKFTILFVGRLVEEKGVWELLEAFERLKKKNQNLELKIIGKGPEEGKIERWIKEKNLESAIKLAGGVSYDQMPQEYQQTDLLVLASKSTPTWAEQFGFVLIEAMASGLPIVASQSGAIPEVTGDCALLATPGDWRELEKILEKLICDYNLRRRLGIKARERAEKYFDCKQAAQKVFRLYQKILEE